MEMLERAMDQSGLGIGGQLVNRGIALLVLLIGQVDVDSVVAGLRDFRFRVVRDGHVDRARAGMEEVKGPEIEGTASEIGAHRRPDNDLFHGEVGLIC